MDKKYFLLLFFLLLWIQGCRKDDNPVEPNQGSQEANILYNGKEYPSQSLSDWGMGSAQKEYVHNDKDYEWYIDQVNTGQAAQNNCGPSCATMAIKWYDKNFSKTAEDARDMYPMNNGWWYTNNIIDYLNYYNIPNATFSFTGAEQLENILKDGNIAIICISTEFLRYNSKMNQRVDRFYSYASGHFLVLKGFRKVDDETFFEAYDSNNWNEVYSDGSQKGKSRHYRAVDISNAIKNWWKYVIIINKNKIAKIFAYPSVDTEKIIHMWGR